MSRGFRAASRVSILIASVWMLLGPLPPGGALVFAQEPPTGAASDVFGVPYLERLRETTPILPNDEIRALWVVRDALVSPESINRLIDFAVQTRIHLLFVQVRGRGDAFYRSALVPPALQLRAPLSDFDPLEYLVTVAHRSGISVHAWINVFLIWSDTSTAPPATHLVVRHPEWLLTDADGARMDRIPASRRKALGVEGAFISPTVSEMRRYMERVVRELARNYPIDGIHLDYIRYPNPTFSFNPADRSAFAIRWGVDPAELFVGDRARFQAVVGGEALAFVDSVFARERIEDVDSMVVAVRGACGSLPLSAAVVADPRVALQEKGQDWPTWVHQRWVDFVVPMAYNAPPLELEYKAQVYNRLVGRERVLIGLGVFGDRDQFLQESVDLLRAVGVSGYAIFSYNALVENPFAADLIERAVLPPDTTTTDEEGDDPDGDPQ